MDLVALITRDTLGYRILLFLHILSAIIGFGAVFLNGVYGARIRAYAQSGKAREASAVAETNFYVSEKVGLVFIYLVVVFGLGLVGMSDGVFDFGQTWVWLALLLYVIAVGLSHSVLQPNVKRMNVLMAEMAGMPDPAGPPSGPPPQAAELAERGRMVGITGTTLDIMMMVILGLMIWKPGL